MKIKRIFSSTVIMIAVLSLACAALAISWPEWRDDLRAEGYYGYGYFKLPDTGQTKCYDGSGTEIVPCPAPGNSMAQDGSYSINPMSYTDNEDGTVTDNNTGLMWQQDENPTANWYQASGTFDATFNPTSQDVCAELTTGDYSDWWLPTKKELMSIVNYGIPDPGPTINTTYFSNTNSSLYWSSTLANNPTFAFGVTFNDGAVVDYDKGNDYYVRCVRGGELDFGNFIDNDDGTVTDNSTGLMWQKGEPGGMTWSDSLNYCENLELPLGSGQTDWRLPNNKELESITNDSGTVPAIDTTFFPNAYDSLYWSSTTYADNPYNAWYVHFGYYGSVYFNDNKGYDHYIRCVRGGEFNLTVTKSGGGSGSVTSDDGGIDCGSDCSEAYDSGTVVNLTATPNAGSQFTGWSGDCDAYGQVTMDEGKTCTATFRRTWKTTFEENDPAISYTGTWNSFSCPSCSGGAVKLSGGLGGGGATASLTFNGRGIKWVAVTSNQLGKARVYIDNVLKMTVDLYSYTAKTKQVVYQKTGLTKGSHTIRIEFTGTKNISSKGNVIDLDAFEVMP